LQEWETAEYIRDARASGKKISLIVLGHTASEDAGSQYMVEWLNKNVPGIKATHIFSGNPFQFR
jgi:putative NIF3 family GTP cyclohydrolase 1 type 2